MSTTTMGPEPPATLSREYRESFRGFVCKCGFQWAGPIHATWEAEPCPQCGTQTVASMFWVRAGFDVTAEEAALRTGRTVEELHRLVDEGHIGCYQPPGKTKRWRRFNVDEIRKRLEKPPRP